MIDLHCHILPGIDDGAPDLPAALDMARAFVADGVSVVACTPHIVPGLYHNTGPGIRRAVAGLQSELDREGIPLRLVPGADNHVTPDCVAKLGTGELLALADSRYVLIEPPHHVAPQRLETVFFDLLTAGYVPILTHPERLRWIEAQYTAIQRLARAGVWMQITAGSLAGAFGSGAQYWAERMLDEGWVQVLATDAHDARRRHPDLGRGRALAARRVGEQEARHLVLTRPSAVLDNLAPAEVPRPVHDDRFSEVTDGEARSGPTGGDPIWPRRASPAGAGGVRGIAGRLRRLLAG
ncbi:MAG: capsular biosynthesis protein [Hyphomicrobiaceae bacterium]|nr:capsular biosynthesis protein [Hyphomicrobiaceae bacterium]